MWHTIETSKAYLLARILHNLQKIMYQPYQADRTADHFHLGADIPKFNTYNAASGVDLLINGFQFYSAVKLYRPTGYKISLGINQNVHL